MSETVTIHIDTLNRIIKDLERAVTVCNEVDSLQGDDCEKTYPFATGYSRSTMTFAALDLKRAISG